MCPAKLNDIRPQPAAYKQLNISFQFALETMLHSTAIHVLTVFYVTLLHNII